MYQRTFPAYRARRMRRDAFSRRMIQEHTITPADLIWPVFVLPDARGQQPVDSMPGVFRLGIEPLLKQAEEALS
ncbi:MAG TPA: porphobilinogen synthase, partial [Halothiobacillaceae bacterium]|nr:porphobilinogen synthase [Halothiobacillaceae bacterium]